MQGTDFPAFPGAHRAIARGLRCRCPMCGGGSLFASWLEPRPACPRCGLRLNRGESDHFLGAYAVNFVTAEVLLAFFLLIVGVVTWPRVPWNVLLYGGLVLMVIAPIAFFPVSRTLWLALDLTFREPTTGDFTDGPARTKAAATDR